MLTLKQVYGLQLIIEEMLMNLLLPSVSDILLSVGISENQTVELDFVYKGAKFNPCDDKKEDNLSCMIIKGQTKQIKHTFKDKVNTLHVVV